MYNYIDQLLNLYNFSKLQLLLVLKELNLTKQISSENITLFLLFIYI